MIKPVSNLPSDESSSPTAPLKVPRLASLLHRVQHARDADGQPIELLDELMFLLDDPPLGTRDRWQAGADLCVAHGIPTSRMSVWRLYRDRIAPWRREQNPTPAGPAPDAAEIARLELHVRHLAAQRLLEMLNDPRLTPAQLLAILRDGTRRQQVQLARDQFNDKLDLQATKEHRERIARIDIEAREKALDALNLDPRMKGLVRSIAMSLYSTP